MTHYAYLVKWWRCGIDGDFYVTYPDDDAGLLTTLMVWHNRIHHPTGATKGQHGVWRVYCTVPAPQRAVVE